MPPRAEGLIFFLFLLGSPVSGFDPFSFIVGVASAAYCKLTECCAEQWTSFNVSGLETALQSQVYGQHIVQQVVYRSIRAHVKDANPKKALVLSFHGWTGGGKNLVASLIMKHLYRLNVRSAYAHTFVASVHFPHDAHIQTYRDQLHQWIKTNVSRCPLSLFVFDETDKMPVGLIDTLKPFLDFHEELDGVNYRHSIFIFLSNTAGNEISSFAYKQWENGRDREDIKAHELEELITQAAFNDKSSGMWHSSLLQQHLISHLVPFLPLTRKHTLQCARDELKQHNVPMQKLNSLAESVVNELQFYPPETKMFSKSGCKRVAEKVRLVLDW